MNILFISTNTLWGGSEELWYRSECMLAKEGYKIHAVNSYQNTQTSALQNKDITHLLRPANTAISITTRILNKIRGKVKSPAEKLKNLFLQINSQ